MEINSFLDYKKLFEFDIYILLDSIVKKMQESIIAFNHQQLQDGFDAKGQKIKTIDGDPYTIHTMSIRASKGLQTNNVDLKVTGDFYKTFKVKMLKNGYEVTANFQKEDGYILDNFFSSYDFLGLNKGTLNKWVNKEVLPELVKKIKSQISK